MMLSTAQRTCIQTKGVVIGRVLLGLLFVVSGLGMLFTQTPAGVAGWLGSLGIPLPMVAAILVIAVKIIAGSALIIGMRVGAAAAALAIFTLITIPVAHWGADELTNALKNLSIVGGLMYVMAFGAGNWNEKSSM